MYNWQLQDWPNFTYDLSLFEDIQKDYIKSLGETMGMTQVATSSQETGFIIELMVNEAIKTSEIEGEFISRKDITSSIKKNLGMNDSGIETIRDRRAKGIAQLMIDVRNSFMDELSIDMLLRWHTLLMTENRRIHAGQWRTHAEPMQVVSGSIGKETIHFEAPPSNRVPQEMKHFIDWFNASKVQIKNPLVRAAIAHLYFESIHPFEDGNGRIGRAISEKALAESMGHPMLLSLSSTIEKNKKDYYQALKKGQQSNQINGWIEYFSKTIQQAQQEAKELILFTLKKSNFFDEHREKLNARQLKVIHRMLEEGPEGFKGGLTAKKYISITQTSKATATRDLQQLVEAKIIQPYGNGRSVHYRLQI